MLPSIVAEKSKAVAIDRIDAAMQLHSGVVGFTPFDDAINFKAYQSSVVAIIFQVRSENDEFDAQLFERWRFQSHCSEHVSLLFGSSLLSTLLVHRFFVCPHEIEAHDESYNGNDEEIEVPSIVC